MSPSSKNKPVHQSKAFYEELFQSAQDGIFVMEDNRFIECNPAVLKMFDVDEPDIIGHSPVEFSPEYQPDGVLSETSALSKINAALAGEPQHFEWLHKKYDNTLFFTEVSLNRIYYNKKSYVQAIVRDVTDKKNRENELMNRLKRIQRQEKAVVDVITSSFIVDGNLNEASKLILNELSETIEVERVSIRYINENFIPADHQKCYLQCHGKCHHCETFDFTQYPDYLDALKKERTINAHDVTTDPRVSELLDDYLLPNNIVSLLSAPVRVAGELIGVLHIEQIENVHGWQLDEITFAAEMADQITQTILNKQKREAEQALIESEEKYRKIYETIPDCICIADENGCILEANRMMSTVYGYTNEELIGMNAKSLVQSDYHGVFFNFVELARQGKPFHGQTIDIRKDGSRINVDIHGAAIYIDGKNHLLAVLRDITENKRIIDSLRESEERFRNILASSPDAIGVIDMQGNLIECNKALEELHGYTREELLQMTSFDLIAPECREKAKRFLHDALQGKEIKEPFLELVKKSKEKFYCDMSTSLLHDARGNPVAMIIITKDISEQLEAERIIQESEIKFRSIFNSVPLGMFIYELNDENELIFKDFNPSAEKILCVTCESYLDKTIEQAFPALMQTEVPDAYREVARKGKLYYREDIFYNENDIVGSYEVHAFQYAPRQIVVAFTDITEKKKSEEALKLSEERYRHVVNNATEAIFIVQDMNLVFVNSMMSEIFGYPAEELLEKTGTDLIHKEDLPLIIERYQKRIKGEPAVSNYSVRIINSEGNIRWAELNSVQIDWGDRPAILIFLNDITDRHLAELKLQASEKRYRDLFINLRDGVGIVDLKGKFLDANPAFLDMLGYSLDELVQLSYKDVTPEKWLDKEIEYVQMTIKQGYTDLYEKEYISKKGTFIPVELRFYMVYDQDGKGIAMVGVARDISERKKAQDLMVMAERAERLASLGTLAAGIAHEINQPLTALKVKVDGLLYWGMEKPEILQKNLVDNLQFVSDEAEKISEIIKHMRSLVRQEKQGPPDHVEINKMVKRGILMVQRKLMSMRIELILQLDESNPVLLAHANPVERVVINLIMNAANALTKTRKRYKQITVKTSFENNNGILQVIDNGPGIDEEYLPYIFDPFFTTTQGGEGMGLGLSIIQNIISSYGGTVSVKNRKRSGAVFTVKLPLVMQD